MSDMCDHDMVGEVIILSCLPGEIMPFAVSSTTNLIGAALYFTYNIMYIFGWKSFDVLTGDFTISMIVIFMPALMLLMRHTAYGTDPGRVRIHADKSDRKV